MAQQSPDELFDSHQEFAARCALLLWTLHRARLSRLCGSDDVRQLALLGLLKACRSTRYAGRLSRWRTYAWRCMQNEILRPVGKRSRKRVPSLTGVQKILDDTTRKPRVALDAEDMLRLKRALSRLSPPERALVIRSFGLEGRRRAGQPAEVDRRRVRLNAALDALRRRLKGL